MDLAKYIDHTLLKPQATQADIIKLCQEARVYNFCSVCVNPYWVAFCKQQLHGSDVKVCTVIGFPLGYQPASVKAFEAADAVSDGADEIDMVINVSALKNGEDDVVLNEIKAVRKACEGQILKVIIETCCLTDDEKVRCCELVTEGGADYIKTSTGFGKAGAQLADIEIFRQHIGENVRIKAAGGIRTREDMEASLAAGCDRIGCSAAKILFDEA